MRIIDLRNASSKEDIGDLLPRPVIDTAAATDIVRPLVDEVRHRGAEALYELDQRFDGVRPASLLVAREALQEALANLDPAVEDALRVSIRNAQVAHTAQLPTPATTEVVPGGTVFQRWVPLGRVGLYVPGGLAAYPSSVVMNVVTAQVAGVPSMVVATPPQKEFGGLPHPTILAACELLGVHEVIAVGGAQAIAAMAYGFVDNTGPTPYRCRRVDKVTGPGNVYVAAAKRIVHSVCGIDSEAGTTEIAILADDSADPAYVCADLISQAEHDPAAASVLVTPSEELATTVLALLPEMVAATAHRERITTALSGPQSGIVLTASMEDAIAVVEAYAPEHLEVHTRDALEVALGITTAGAVFVGDFTPVPLGDYVAGSNHVLPTGGTARYAAGLNVTQFLRSMQVVEYSPDALRSVATALIDLANAEGLPAHGQAARIRFGDYAGKDPLVLGDALGADEKSGGEKSVPREGSIHRHNDAYAAGSVSHEEDVRIHQDTGTGLAHDASEADTDPLGGAFTKESLQNEKGEELAKGASHIRLPLRPELADVEPYGAPMIDVPVRLNVNENPYSPSEAVIDSIVEAVREAATHLNRYADRDARALRADLAEYVTAESGVEVKAKEVWAANGSNEVMLHLLQAFGGPGRSVVAQWPTYSMYHEYARDTHTRWVLEGASRAAAEGIPSFEADRLIEAMRRERPAVVLIPSPNNPTGQPLAEGDLRTILAASRTTGPRDSSGEPSATLVVVDEAYAEFREPEVPSALELLADNPNLVVTRTMSKAFAAAGLRLGYLIAHPLIVHEVQKVRLPYHLSLITQASARAALRHTEAQLAQVEGIRRERNALAQWLIDQGFTVAPSASNFLLFGPFDDAHALWRDLVERGVLIREVGPRGYLRVTVGTPEENEAFKAALKEAL